MLTIFPNPLRQDFQALVSFQTTVTKKHIDRYLSKATLCYARLHGCHRSLTQRKLIDFVQMFSPFFGSDQLPLCLSSSSSLSPSLSLSSKVSSINNISLPLEIGALVTIALTSVKLLLVTRQAVVIQQPLRHIMKWEKRETEREREGMMEGDAMCEFKYWVLLDEHSIDKEREKEGERDGERENVMFILSRDMRESMVQLGRCDVVSLYVHESIAHDLMMMLERVYRHDRERAIEIDRERDVMTTLTTTTTTGDSSGEDLETLREREREKDEGEGEQEKEREREREREREDESRSPLQPPSSSAITSSTSTWSSFQWKTQAFTRENNLFVRHCDLSLSLSPSLSPHLPLLSSWQSIRMENHVNVLLTMLLEEEEEDEQEHHHRPHHDNEIDEMRVPLVLDDLDLSLSLSLATEMDGEDGLISEGGAGVGTGGEKVSQSKKSSRHISLKSLKKASKKLYAVAAGTNTNTSHSTSSPLSPQHGTGTTSRGESKRFVGPPLVVVSPTSTNGTTVAAHSLSLSPSPSLSSQSSHNLRDNNVMMNRRSSRYRGIPYRLVAGEDMVFEIDDQIDWMVNTVKHFRAQHVLSGSVCVTNYRVILTTHW
jgi:hypothetical protein